jgi:hypothetical protein
MEYAVSRAIVAVDHFLEVAITQAWEAVSRTIEGTCDWRNLVPEDEYGGGDICSLDDATSSEDDEPLE